MNDSTAIPALRLPALGTALLGGLMLLPRIHRNPWLLGSVAAATAVLVLLQIVLRFQIARRGRRIAYDVVPQRVHWVQAAMQSCVYVYWGWYWSEVYGHVPLILAQIVFAYTLDMLACWLRRDRWVLGFGQLPIILSTNLFLWFRDDWFFLQFAMVATGILGKQFVLWTRDGKRTHIFNPSALSLFLFSTGLILTGNTHITWGTEIAATLGLPPGIYVEVFLVGLVVQALFSVTWVTLAAVASLVLLNLAYTGATGSYHFIMTNVPIAVFLGLHLLVTDPATSPRSTLGKLVFGALYGVLTFVLFGALAAFGVPTFYDKLLPVLVLNLTVRWIDRLCRPIEARLSAPAWLPLRGNPAAMAIWVSLFVLLTATGFLGREHPGRDPQFWKRACDEGKVKGCETWVTFLELSCRTNAESCNSLGSVLAEGKIAERKPLEAAKRYGRACDVGHREACRSLQALFAESGPLLRTACQGGDGESCFLLGEVHRRGIGVSADPTLGFNFARESCAHGLPIGCARVGGSLITGEGTVVDEGRARDAFERACRGRHPPSCAALGMLHQRGMGVPQNAEVAAHWFREACKLGHKEVCRPGDDATPSETVLEPLIEIQKLGG